jgi:hypothetical protein
MPVDGDSFEEERGVPYGLVALGGCLVFISESEEEDAGTRGGPRDGSTLPRRAPIAYRSTYMVDTAAMLSWRACYQCCPYLCPVTFLSIDCGGRLL